MKTEYEKQIEQITHADGFIAALDQSGGSTPKALRLYGIPDDSYVKGESSMFDAMHDFRVRIMTSPSFGGDRILAVILFENTMERLVNGIPVPKYLWEEKNIVPIIKVDQGLMPEDAGVQKMKTMTKLDDLLDRAVLHKVFGTKMRSVIKKANAKGIQDIVEQQFTVARKILTKGLHPILEPEIDIHSTEKKECEVMLREKLLENLDKLRTDEKVLLKLTLPSVDNFYQTCIDHPNVLRVVALSGGYSRDEANDYLARNKNMVASFSRALTEGLLLEDSKEEFDSKLDGSIESIFKASLT